MQTEVNAKTDEVRRGGLREGAGEVPRADCAAKLASRLRHAGRQADRRAEEAARRRNPSLNISAGVLYQYDQAAADELKKDQDAGRRQAGREAGRGFRQRARRGARRTVPTTQALPPRRPSPAEAGGAARRPDDRRARGHAVRDRRRTTPKPPTSGRRLAFARHLTERQASAGRPRAGQPRLAAPLRPRARRHAGRLRRARRAADASRTARLAGRRAGPPGLEPEAAAPADHDLDGLPPVVAARRRRKDAVDPDNALLRPLPGPPARRRGAPRPHPGRQRAGSTARRSARRCRSSRTPSARSCPPDDSAAAQRLPPGPAQQAGRRSWPRSTPR